ncbi:MAG: outer membrane beta-barrel domain-containing protein, partial [Deltaproteobacteria bacterium]|nr:outer membrane beta-barrel domain-containing protein [Deltaproteobacteria bacterium]
MKKTNVLLFLMVFSIYAGGLCPQMAVAEESTQENVAVKKDKKQKKKKTVTAASIQEDQDIGNLRISGIDVVQNRVFAKKGRHEFTFGMGAILDNPFLRYELAQFRYNYHFRETFAIELSYQYAFNQQKSLIGQLEGIQCAPGEFFDEDGNDLSNVPGACGVSFSSPPDPFVHTYIANLVWSPIYGKFSIFSRKIYHFDLFFTAGAGYYDTERSGYIGFN